MKTPSPFLGARGRPLPPITEAVADMTAYWLTELMAEPRNPAIRYRWEQWMAADPAHRDAWQRVQALEQHVSILAPGAAHRSLSSLHQPSKRKTLKQLAGVAMLGAGGFVASRTDAWQRFGADYHTDAGQTQQIVLADGSRLRLNTASAVRVDYNPSRRRIQLLYGEIALETAPDPLGRPLDIETDHGLIRPLGTRLVAQQRASETRVSVQQHAVELVRPDWPMPLRVHEGQWASLSPVFTGQVHPLDDASIAWLRGEFMSNGMRLGDFLDDLQRYRSGWLSYTPDIADLRLSALFPYMDTDRVLSALTHTLPVRVKYRTRYWVTVTRAEDT